MFKPGDKVKYKDGGHFSNHERVVTVETVVGSQVWFKETKTHTSSTSLELANDGPVRTVTRREIVPGVYGRFKVVRNDTSSIGLTPVTRNGTTEITHPSLTAEELREAAHLFTQLAEALDDATA